MSDHWQNSAVLFWIWRAKRHCLTNKEIQAEQNKKGINEISNDHDMFNPECLIYRIEKKCHSKKL